MKPFVAIPGALAALAGVAAAAGLLSPLSTSKPTFATVSNSQQPSGFWALSGGNKTPLPTNQWYQNLVVGSGSDPISPWPYQVSAVSDGFAFCYPSLSTAENAVFAPFVKSWTLRAVEQTSTHVVTGYDELGVNVQWLNSARTVTMQSYFVRGSPYLTGVMLNTTPRLDTIHAILSVDGPQDIGGGLRRTTVKLNSGQSWALYVSDATAKWNQDGASSLVLSKPLSGFVRVAYIASDDQHSFNDALSALDRYAGAIPTSARVEYTLNSNFVAELIYDYTVHSLAGQSLAMLALPHHFNSLAGVGRASALDGYRSFKGPMRAVVGSKWRLIERLPTGREISWFGRYPVLNSDKSRLVQLLEADIADVEQKGISPGDPYFFGKAIARAARFALMSEEVGRQDLVQRAIAVTKKQIEPWLRGSNPNALVYDQSWGGIVSTNGARDQGADFGNGIYNDHHFHYGYFVYAAAVIGKYDQSWLKSNREPVLALLRDYANPSRNDPHFTVARHKDLFDYHSWASGLVPFGDGRNQESTSEAVNAYYAAYLLSLAMPNDFVGDVQAFRRFALLMLHTEIVGSQLYWQIHSRQPIQIYPDPIKSRRVVGVLWHSKADYATWFGGNPEYIHGIQMLPYTPVSAALLQPQWVREQYAAMNGDSVVDRASQSWAEILVMANALVDVNSARTKLAKYSQHDDGNSASNVLYWVSTCCRG
ncbi:glycoside hydrolase [Ramicandelaber brevisporus]|nr:glycoside hydrolase [Ramicandelaber brevisporus]